MLQSYHPKNTIVHIDQVCLYSPFAMHFSSGWKLPIFRGVEATHSQADPKFESLHPAEDSPVCVLQT